ncbi:MAG: hypothetical protein Q8L87_02145 [Anaerolineales bacterium]|nr:hypothetical protein [Anaerolineales bacterium]
MNKKNILIVFIVVVIATLGFAGYRQIAAKKAATVEWAARIYRVPLNEFLAILNQAIAKKQGG